MNKHPHEEVILAYYRGEEIEWRMTEGESWRRWRRIQPYPVDGVIGVPAFKPKYQYRIKPQPPKLHTVELTKQEIEAIWVVTRRISGCPIDSARAHIDMVAHKLALFLDAGRGNQLRLWDGISGGMCFSKRLPE